MAVILNDSELERLLGTVIVDGVRESIRPNSYILRLGSEGEFLNAGKEFSLGKGKKGIRIPPTESVALTALETVDFRSETVAQVYPGCALHGLISPTTDLSREGLVAATTQIDAGYCGTLNWTITNATNQERRFLHEERLFRLTILKLEEGEVPLRPYEGDYQKKTGYVRSLRKGAPAGMRESEWEDASVQGGPEALLDSLLKSGYPWHALARRLKSIDEQFEVVSEEYARIDDKLGKLSADVDGIRRTQSEVMNALPLTVTKALEDQATALQNRWMLISGSAVVALVGLVLTVTGNDRAFGFVKTHGALLGMLMIIVAAATIIAIVGRKKSPPDAQRRNDKG